MNTTTPKKGTTGYPSIDKPWLKFYSEETINAPLPECSLFEYLWQNNKDYPNDVALNYLGKLITYGELFENIDKCQKALTAIGVKEKEIVTIALPSIPEAVYLVYAVNKMGAIANMIHPLAGENEILGYLNEVGSSVCLMFTGTYDIIKNSLNRTSVKTAVVISATESMPFVIKQAYKLKEKEPSLPNSDTVINWKNFITKGKDTVIHTVKKDINETAIISHTGGTTGVPKGVMCSDRSINAEVWQIGCCFPHHRQERMLIVLPPFINYNLVNGIFEGLLFGFVDILIPKYEPEKFAEYVEKYQPNHINTIPPYLEAMLNIPKLKTMDLSCLGHLNYGGEGLDPQKEEEINKLLLSRNAPYKICKGLGSTELVSGATVAFNDENNLLGSSGAPLVKTNCKIVAPNSGEECKFNEIGEICFSGPQLMIGYYHNQEATDEIVKVHGDGERWLHTGDLGYVSEDGVVFLKGRIKRIIMTKGKDGVPTKLFPDRIESVIVQHPAVDICCVIGIPDDDRVNYAKAVIVLKEGTSATDELTSELLGHCKKNLPEYMLPEEIEYLSDLPRTARGKIDYKSLEERYSARK